ncbi:MAG TPA: cytochrome C oxidase subunit IV family protein [Thermoanaerobaculia bacterium]|nr:cytochrome C oxidase subunit IV family protein [Thermoanaerobaculia bacterium]
MTHTQNSAAPAPHVMPVSTYLLVFLALMCGTALTVAAAYVDLGWANNAVALAIAIAKSTLVVLYFMHVKENTRLIPAVIFSGLFMLLILFVNLLADYGTRGWLGVEGR